MNTRNVSPAAAAAVSRLLSRSGLKRATEFRKGIEFEGYFAEPRGDHVQVDYTPGFLIAPEESRAIVIPNLARCKEVLVAAGYTVEETIEENYVYGGNEPLAMPVLEVRKAEWTQR